MPPALPSLNQPTLLPQYLEQGQAPDRSTVKIEPSRFAGPAHRAIALAELLRRARSVQSDSACRVAQARMSVGISNLQSLLPTVSREQLDSRINVVTLVASWRTPASSRPFATTRCLHAAPVPPPIESESLAGTGADPAEPARRTPSLELGSGAKARSSRISRLPLKTTPPRTHSPLKGGLRTPAVFAGCIRHSRANARPCTIS